MSDEATNVVRLKVAEVGDGAELSPDAVLDAAKGKAERLVVTYIAEDGELHLCGSHGSRETLWLLQRAILFLMLDTH